MRDKNRYGERENYGEWFAQRALQSVGISRPRPINVLIFPVSVYGDDNNTPNNMLKEWTAMMGSPQNFSEELTE